MKISFSMPFRLVNLANERSHWGAKARRAKIQREGARLLTHAALFEAGFAWQQNLKLRITITRIGKRGMDSDGLAISAKHVRDGIADAIGVDDGDERLRWEYQQRRGSYGVEVEVAERTMK